MLIKQSYTDIETPTGTMRVQLVYPNLPAYPQAKFPGVIVFSEIYQTTGPVMRYAADIASQGYVVAAPCSFHEFAGPHPIPYDTKGTDAGNAYKARKLLSAYDSDCRLTLDLLQSLPNCNGRLAATGMCLGGHLAFRAAFDKRVEAAVCFFPTDIHEESLGTNKAKENRKSDSQERAKEIEGEVVLIFGVDDGHVPFEGRTKIRGVMSSLHPKTRTSFLELQANHAFIRDESSKDRYDAALTRVCFGLLLETFERTIGRDLGPKGAAAGSGELVC
ncbi:putative carboxymethylenebutenolidase [Atractiella rhizophila]|nr:putative carboxymethylenebutenolidase [Atractiella rhizophila]